MDEEKREVLEALYQYMKKWLRKIDEIIESLRAGSLDELDNLSDGLDGLPWMAEVLQNTREICHIDPPFPLIKSTMSTLVMEFEAQQYTSAADSLEQKLIPMVAEWLDVVEEVLEEEDE